MNGNMNCGMATTDKTALHPPSPWTTYVKGDPLATHSVQQGRGTHRIVSIIMQTEGVFVNGSAQLPGIDKPGQSLISHSRDQFSLGMLKTCCWSCHLHCHNLSRAATSFVWPHGRR